MGALSLLGIGRVKVVRNGDKLGKLGQSEEYLRCEKRVKELRMKRIEYGELDTDDSLEFIRLHYPKWNNCKYWEY